jgi:Uma2 family endonuclease
MYNYMPMATSVRHNHITGMLFSEIADMLRRNEINALQEECALVYWGSRIKPEPASLVDVKAIDNLKAFKEAAINDLEYVQPDFILFHKNAYAENARRTRTAGCPDLIVEVWSDSNTDAEKEFKYELYSSSKTTEHWYIEQDTNDVKCYYGKEILAGQSISNILRTVNGLKFDLRYLAV